MSAHQPNRRAVFREMTESTRDDWNIIMGEMVQFGSDLSDRVLVHLRMLASDHGGFPIDRLQHSLQTATRAHRDGRKEDYVVCALLHDIGDLLCTTNHPDMAAAIVKPFVSESLHWMVQHHDIFQGYHFFHHIGLDRNQRDQFRDHPHYGLTLEFCEDYDQKAFDPDYDSMSLGEFEGMVRRVLALENLGDPALRDAVIRYLDSD